MVNSVQPGLWAPRTLAAGDKQYVAAFHSDRATYVLPAGMAAGTPSRPARPGETITLYGVGFGNAQAGEVARENQPVDLPLEVFFGDTPARVAYAGLAPGEVGLYRFDIIVPGIPGNASTPLTFTLGGARGQQTLYTAVSD
jgi:uncharacterized protein (TIGR03437 family)